MPTILAYKPTDFVILRGVEVNNPQGIAHDRMPKVLATLWNEAKFNETGLMVHNDTVFFEERGNDWLYVPAKQRLHYYSRVCLKGDVLVVYEYEKHRIEVSPTSPEGERINLI